MGEVTTHTTGRVVTHSDDDRTSVDVVQLPQRDAAVQAAAPPATKTAPAKPATPAATPTSPVKAATKQKAARIKKGKKR